MKLQSQYLKSLLTFMLLAIILSGASAQNGLINPMDYFTSKSKSVIEKSYYANVSIEKAKQYFKNLGMIRYSVNEFSAETIRFRNTKRTVFIMVFPISPKRVYIVMSRSQYVDEIDA